jgi:predicted component of type VI protein secretion system
VILARQVAALLGELGATRTRATQAEAEKARAVAAAAAAAAPQPAAHDDSKRLLGQLAALHDEVVHYFSSFCCVFVPPVKFSFYLLNPCFSIKFPLVSDVAIAQQPCASGS